MELIVDDEIILKTVQLEDVENRYKVIEENRNFLKRWLGVERATIIQEEKDDSSHFHIWMLPIWKDIKEDINPRIIKNNIEQYMNLFDFENNKERIIECNNKMKEFLNSYTY